MLVTVVFFCLLASCFADVDVTNVAARGNDDFGFKVYRELAKKPGNILVCPLSMSTILGLTMMGAEQRTLTQMADTLSLPTDKSVVSHSFEQLTHALRSEGTLKLNIANKVFVNKDTVLKNEFKSYAVGPFNAEVDNINFAKNVEATRTMNSWVEEKTEDKIKNLLSPDQITSDTRMVLINAVYFKGDWDKPFTLGTQPLAFHVSEHDTVDVPRLYQENTFRYYDDTELKAQFLELPYSNKQYSLVLILPHEFSGLSAVEHKLSTSFYDKMRRSKVKVTIPEFKLEKTIPFVPILKKLGMTDAFGAAANFGGLSNETLYISEVVQKTFIQVDKKGTEAAAASAVLIGLASAPVFSSPTVFNCDRPFLFMLYQKETKTPLFVGRLSNPH